MIATPGQRGGCYSSAQEVSFAAASRAQYFAPTTRTLQKSYGRFRPLESRARLPLGSCFGGSFERLPLVFPPPKRTMDAFFSCFAGSCFEGSFKSLFPQKGSSPPSGPQKLVHRMGMNRSGGGGGRGVWGDTGRDKSLEFRVYRTLNPT